MKNCILFSTSCNDKRLNNRVNDWLNKNGKNRCIAVIPSFWSATTHEYLPMAAANMGFKEYLVVPVGENFSRKRWEMALTCGAIYLCGGNTPEFWTMLHLRGLDKDLIDFANHGLLMGMSAGIHIMSPTIELSLVADGNYLGLSGDELNSLGLVDFLVKPHADAWMYYEELFRNYATKYGKPVYMIKDGQAVWACDHGIREYGGTVTKFYPYRMVA